jgi:ParB-like chromosome segregation protein Spo0J
VETKTIPIAKINTADYNPRVDLLPGDPEYDAIRSSIDTHGATLPLVWNTRSSTLVGGHQRLKVMRDLGYSSVEVVEVDLGETDEKLLNVALNKIEGRWDDAQLLALVDQIVDQGGELPSVGFNDADYDDLLLRADNLHAVDFLSQLIEEQPDEHDEDSATGITEQKLAMDDYTKCAYPVDAAGRSTVILAVTGAKRHHSTSTNGLALAAIAADYLAHLGDTA